MSTEYFCAALNADLKPSACKFVLISLCNYADEYGETFSTMPNLMRLTCLDEEEIIAQLDDLQRSMIIFDTGRRSQDESKSPIFQVNLELLLSMDCIKDAPPFINQ